MATALAWQSSAISFSSQRVSLHEFAQEKVCRSVSFRGVRQNGAPFAAAKGSWQTPARRRSLAVQAADGVAEVATEPRVREVGKDTFDSALEAAGDKLVVLDMYTQWCGPCKLVAPKIEALAEELQDVVFLKLDCNQENKPLAKQLKVNVVPTFKFFKNKELVGEVRGAKFDALVSEVKKLR